MTDFDQIKQKDFAGRDRFKRVSQRDVLPLAVKGRNVSNIIFGAEVTSASTSIGNGAQIVLSSSVVQNDEYELIAVPYIATYVGTIAPENELPGGSGVDESLWQIIGPKHDYESWSDSFFARHAEFANIYIRNISAGTVTLNFLVKWRYLSSREGGS